MLDWIVSPRPPLDVLLVDPCTRSGTRQPWVLQPWTRAGTRMPSLGLAQIAAWLEEHGVRVGVIDAEVEGLSDAALQARLATRGAPAWVGITATTSTIGAALRTAATCRRALPGVRIVLGGVHPTARPDEVLAHPAVDVVVRGEGEQTMLALAQGAPWAEVSGLSWRRADGAVVHNPDRPHLPDLDRLPLPAYHLFPLHRYRPGLGTARRFPALSMVATRGCPGRCTYCFRTFGDTLRMRSMDRLLDDAAALQSRYGIRQLQFFDDTFTASRRRIVDFCDGLQARGLRLSWACYARVDTVDRALLTRMADAGCHQVCYGVESGDPAILRSIDKRISLQRVRQVVAWTRQAGIQARGTFMLGHVGDTPASIERTVQASLDLDLDLALYNISTPYPGTALFEQAREQGLLRTLDWSLYDRAHMVLDLPTVSGAHVERELGRAWRRFYGRPRYLATRAPRLVPWRGLPDLVGAGVPAPQSARS